MGTHLQQFKARYTVILAVVILVSIVGYLYTSVFNNPNPAFVDTAPTVSIAVATTSVSVLPAAEPGRLIIPSINLMASFTPPLGIEANGEIEVPADYGKVGWYQYSPTPGELGPAVILGHVSSRQGPAIFNDLDQVVVGDEVLIERADGSVATFVVETVEEVSQANFPTDRVYGNIDHAGLRLVTCAGTFDEVSERFSHNTVVFARLRE